MLDANIKQLVTSLVLVSSIGASNDLNIKFDHLSIEQGLSQVSVTCILQDSQGFIWFGTRDGLNRFDGYDFVVYNNDPDDSTSLISNSITALYEDENGNLWIGTREGLDKLGEDRSAFIHFKYKPNDLNSISSDYIFTISGDADFLYIGTWGGGLNRYEKSTGIFTNYRHDPNDPESISHNKIYSLLLDSSGDLWVGTYGGGLDRFVMPEQIFEHYRFDRGNPFSISSDSVGVIFEDDTKENQILWIGTDTGGLNRFDVRHGTFTHIRHDPKDPTSIGNDFITCISMDNEGRLWVGLNKNGISISDRDSKTWISSNKSQNPQINLNDVNVYSMYRDRTGNIWIGTGFGGVNIFKPFKNKFNHTKVESDEKYSVPSNLIKSFWKEENDLWVGTNGSGLNHFNYQTRKWTAYVNDPTNPGSISSNTVRSIFIAQGTTVWLGTVNGLEQFNKKTKEFVHYKNNENNDNSLSHNRIWDIEKGNNGKIWIATINGLNCFDPKDKTFKRYFHIPEDNSSINGDHIRCLYRDNDGFLWIGLWGAGLSKIDLNKHSFDGTSYEFSSYNHDPENAKSISSNRIRAIYKDKSGYVWIGTHGGGLNILDPVTNEFEHLTTKNGLPNNVVYGILEDDDENIWVSTNNGLAKYNRKIKIFTNYDIADGLQGNEFNGGAYFKGADGEFFFGGINGFNCFFPTQIKTNSFIPEIVLTDFKIFNKSMNYSLSISRIDEIMLTYKQNYFSVDFAALDFTAPEKNGFAYMLQGFDSDWTYLNKRRFAEYTQVPPGEYVLRIKGSNNDGVWNEEGVSLKISITPPFWKTGWFRIFVMLSVLGIIFSGYQMRIRNIQAQGRRLKIQVAERTNELAQRKDELQKAHDELDEQVKERTKKLQLSEFRYRQLAKQLLTIQDEERERLSREIHDSMGEYLTTLLIRCGLIEKKKFVNSSEIAQELEIIKGLINGAIEECHRIAFDLSPLSLTKLGLVSALQEVIEGFEERTGIEVVFEESLNGKQMSSKQELMLFRILQEALNNIYRHAKAQSIEICLSNVERQTRFVISDNGKGFNAEEILNRKLEPHQNMGGFGLMSMQERVANLKGDFEIRSTVGEGTKIIVSIPSEAA